MNPYLNEVRKDKRAAQEEMVRLSMAGFDDKLKLYQTALDIVLAEEERAAEPVVEPVVEVKEEVKVAVKKRVVKKSSK